MSKLSQGLGPAQFSIYGSKASRSETPGLKPHPGSVSSHEAKISSLPLAQNCTISRFESVYVPATHKYVPTHPLVHRTATSC